MPSLKRLLSALLAVTFSLPAAPAHALRPSIENRTPSQLAAGMEEPLNPTGPLYYDPQQTAQRLLQALLHAGPPEKLPYFDPKTGTVSLNTLEAASLLGHQPTDSALRRGRKDGGTLADAINGRLTSPETAPPELAKLWEQLFRLGIAQVSIAKSRQVDTRPWTLARIRRVVRQADEDGLSFQPKEVQAGPQSATPLGKELKSLYGQIVRTNNFPAYQKSWRKFLQAHKVPLSRAYDVAQPARRQNKLSAYIDLKRDEKTGAPVPDLKKQVSELKLNRLDSLWHLPRVKRGQTLFLEGVGTWLNTRGRVVFYHHHKPHGTNLPAIDSAGPSPVRLMLEISTRDPHYAVQSAWRVDTGELVYPFDGQLRFHVDPPFSDGRVQPEALLYRALTQVRPEFWKELAALQPKSVYVTHVPARGKHGRGPQAYFEIGNRLTSISAELPQEGAPPLLLTVQLDLSTQKPLRAWRMDTGEAVFPRTDTQPPSSFRVYVDPVRDGSGLVAQGEKPLLTAAYPVWQKVWSGILTPAAREIVVQDVRLTSHEGSDWPIFTFEGEPYSTSIQPEASLPLQVEFSASDPLRRPQRARRMDTGELIYPAPDHRKIWLDPEMDGHRKLSGLLHKAGYLISGKSLQSALRAARRQIFIEKISSLNRDGKAAIRNPLTGREIVTHVDYKPAAGLNLILRKENGDWKIAEIFDPDGNGALPSGRKEISRLRQELKNGLLDLPRRIQAADHLSRLGGLAAGSGITTELLRDLLDEYHRATFKQVGAEPFLRLLARAARLYAGRPDEFWQRAYPPLRRAEFLPMSQAAQQLQEAARQLAAGMEEESMHARLARSLLEKLSQNIDGKRIGGLLFLSAQEAEALSPSGHKGGKNPYLDTEFAKELNRLFEEGSLPAVRELQAKKVRLVFVNKRANVPPLVLALWLVEGISSNEFSGEVRLTTPDSIPLANNAADYNYWTRVAPAINDLLAWAFREQADGLPREAGPWTQLAAELRQTAQALKSRKKDPVTRVVTGLPKKALKEAAPPQPQKTPKDPANRAKDPTPEELRAALAQLRRRPTDAAQYAADALTTTADLGRRLRAKEPGIHYVDVENSLKDYHRIAWRGTGEDQFLIFLRKAVAKTPRDSLALWELVFPVLEKGRDQPAFKLEPLLTEALRKLESGPVAAGAEEEAELNKQLTLLAMGTTQNIQQASEWMRKAGPAVLPMLISFLNIRPTADKALWAKPRGAALALAALHPVLSDEEKQQVRRVLTKTLHSQRLFSEIRQADRTLTSHGHTWLMFVVPALLDTLHQYDAGAANDAVDDMRVYAENRHLISSVIAEILLKSAAFSGKRADFSGDLRADPAGAEETAGRIIGELADEIDRLVRTQPYGLAQALASPKTSIEITPQLVDTGEGKKRAMHWVVLNADRQLDPATQLITNGSECFYRSLWIARQASDLFNLAGIPAKVTLRSIATPIWTSDTFVRIELPGGKSWNLSGTPGMATLGEAFPEQGYTELAEAQWSQIDPREPDLMATPEPTPEDRPMLVPMDWIPVDENHAVRIMAGIRPGNGEPGLPGKDSNVSIFGLGKPVSFIYNVSLVQLEPAQTLYARQATMSVPKQWLSHVLNSLSSRPEWREAILREAPKRFRFPPKQFTDPFLQLAESEEGQLPPGPWEASFLQAYEQNQTVLYDLANALKVWPSLWNAPAPASPEKPLSPGAQPLSFRTQPFEELAPTLYDIRQARSLITRLDRYPAQMKILRETILPALLASKTRVKADPFELTFLVVGSSTGEEVATVTAVVLETLESLRIPLDPAGKNGVKVRVRGVEIDETAHRIAVKRLSGSEPLNVLLQRNERFTPEWRDRVQALIDVLNRHRKFLPSIVELVHADASSPEILDRLGDYDVVTINMISGMFPEKEREIIEAADRAENLWVLTHGDAFGFTAKRHAVYEFGEVRLFSSMVGVPREAVPAWPADWTRMQTEFLSNDDPLARIRMAALGVGDLNALVAVKVLPSWIQAEAASDSPIEQETLKLLDKAADMIQRGQLHLPPGSVAFLLTLKEVQAASAPVQEKLDRLLALLPQAYVNWVDGARKAQAGAEENQGLLDTLEAGRLIRELFTDHAGRVEPMLAAAAAELQAKLGVGSEEAWVRAFLHLLRTPQDHRPSPIPPGLLSVPVYRSGPFSHAELVGTPQEKTYLHEDWLPSIRKVLEGVSSQLTAEKVPVKPDDLGLPEIARLMTLLFYARGKDGELLTKQDGESEMYRWSYRELPRLLAPRLAARHVDRLLLAPALENPFRLTNDAGNDAVQRAIGELLADPSKGFVDEPARLQADRHLLEPWLKLTIATNLVDYSRTSILEEIDREGDLARYILNRMHTPFAEQLGGERFIGEFLGRLSRPNVSLVHLPDNNAELAASLKLAEVLLSAFPSLRISMVVKADNGVMNDGSLADAVRLLQSDRSGLPDVYRRLRAYMHADRFKLTAGSPMHGTPLNLLPEEALAELQKADVVLSEGEANTWNLNGLAKEIYLGLRLKWPDGVRFLFGLELPPEIAAQRPPAFFRIDGTEGPYYRDVFSPDPGNRRTIAQTVAAQSRHDAAGAEEWPQRLRRVTQQLQEQGWVVAPRRLEKELAHAWYTALARLSESDDVRQRETWTARLKALKDFLFLLEELFVKSPRHSAVRVEHHRFTDNHDFYIARLLVRNGGEPVAARLIMNRKPGLPKISILLPNVGEFTLGRDADQTVPRPLLHLDIRDRTGTTWWGHRNLVPVWSKETQQPLETFQHFQKKLLERVEQLSRAQSFRPVDFNRAYPTQSDEAPEGTERVLVFPMPLTVRVYWQSNLVPIMPGLMKERAALEKASGGLLEIKDYVYTDNTTTLPQRDPGIILWDSMLGEQPPFPTRLPVLKHQLGNPFPWELSQILQMALAGRVDLPQQKMLKFWSFSEEGQSYLAIAVSA